jgi:hypothetical protein
LAFAEALRDVVLDGGRFGVGETSGSTIMDFLAQHGVALVEDRAWPLFPDGVDHPDYYPPGLRAPDRPPDGSLARRRTSMGLGDDDAAEERDDLGLEQAFSRLAKGWFAVDAPREMQIDVSEILCVSAIRNWIRKDLIEAGLLRDNPQVSEATLASMMRVELVPDSQEDFTVQALSSREQPILTEEVTTWEWLVTPRCVGERKLLRVTATNILGVNGRWVEKSHRVKTITVHVVVAVVPLVRDEERCLQPPPRELREMVRLALVADSDLDAFCLDYFRNIYDRFTQGMDRVAKVNLLLRHGDADRILAKLHEDYPAALRLRREDG